MFYSWPSRGRIRLYRSDERTAAKTTESLTAYLRRVLEAQPAKLHIVAHSMGNRPLTAALLTLAKQLGDVDPQRRPFGNVILAAADMDPNELCPRMAEILRVADRVTIYFSKNDRAVALSRWWHQQRVVGADGVPSMDRLDVIDASGVSSSFLGHGYIADVPVLRDVFDLIRDGKPASERYLEKLGEGESERYRLVPFFLRTCS
jgi:esterase/lipase superfamily enzyme